MRQSHRTAHAHFRAPAALLMAALLFTGSVAAQTRVAGWIDTPPAGAAGQPSAPPVRITRSGAEIAYDAGDGLRSCDRLKLIDATAVVRITLSNKERLRLDAERRELTLPCDPTGVTQQLAAFLRAIWGSGETRRINATAASSRTGSRTRPPIIPALVGDRSEIAGGERALYLAWSGGDAPFSIRIERHGDDASIAALQNVSTRSATLPSVHFAPGRYVVVITDGRGRVLRDEQLHVVDAQSVPPFPPDLDGAAIAKDAKRLYYADFLAGYGDGRFCLEALQQAASISPRTAAAREWLSGWTGPD